MRRVGVESLAELLHQPLCHSGVSEVFRGGHTQPQEEETYIFTCTHVCGRPRPSSGGRGCWGLHWGLR